MQRILMISLSNIGDAVMTTPVLERLHQLYPDAIIDLVCDKRSSEIFRHCPYRGTIFHKEKKLGWKGVLSLVSELRNKRYDLIVDLRTDGLAWLLRARRRLTKWGHTPYGPHAVEDLISIIDRINPERVIPDCKIWLAADEIKRATELLKPLPDGQWLALAPGANWPGKIWGNERFAAMANLLRDRLAGVVLLGGPNDSERSQAVASQLQLPYLDLTAQTDLLTATAVMAQCALLVGNDSGLGHLASSVGTATLTVFGPGEPQRYHPWGNRNRWLAGEAQSLQNISPEQVTALARDMLKP